MNMVDCLYKCGSGAESKQIYHVYPQSASNIQVTLETGVVCDKCNHYFSGLENYFIQNHPGADARILRLRETKKGKQPKHTTQAGEITRTIGENGIQLQMPMSDIKWSMTEGGGIRFDLAAKARPYDPVRISRVLGKIAMETACQRTDVPGVNLNPYSAEFDPLREYVRFWRQMQFIWFAYKAVEEPGGEPRIAIVRSGATIDTDILGCSCEIRLPGFSYLTPYPPFLDPKQIKVALEGWTVVDSPDPQTASDLTATINLVRKSSEDSAPQTK
jgi:hypothetical protein